MCYTTFAVEFEVKVHPKRMWYACVEDAHNSLPKIIPEHISSIEYIGGCGCTQGSVREVNYGKPFEYMSCKETFLEVDNLNFQSKMKVVEGGVLNKLFHHHVQSINFVQGCQENSCFVRWCMQYDSMGSRQFHKSFKREIFRLLKLVEKYLMTHNDYTSV